MMRRRYWEWFRIAVFTAAGSALLLMAGCRKQQAGPQPNQPKPPSPVSIALHSMADAARLETMRWPNFADLKQPVEAFYGAHNFEPVWLNGDKPTPQARQMMAAFAASSADALEPEDYDSSRWAARATAIHSDHDRAAFDMAMTVAAMRYLNDEHNGRVNPKRFNFGIDVSQKRYDLAQFLNEKILASSNVGAVLNGVPPQSEEYRRTQAAYRRYVDMAKRDAGGGLPEPGRQLRPGDAYAGAERMRALLILDDDLPAETPETDAARYDPALVGAVKHFQFHHGLTADGKIGPPTVAAMNVPTATRVNQLAIALERWRWLPDAYQNAPVFVNLPEYKLRVYSNEPLPQPQDDGASDAVAAENTGKNGAVAASTATPSDNTNDHTRIVLEMNVVTGKAGIKPPEKKGEAPEDHQTPMLVNQMRYLIFRPYWLVPTDITKREILPHLVADPEYLGSHGYEVVDHHQKPVVYTSADEARLLHGQLTVRQGAGTSNSLGLVKFMFPNPYSIYLHSTPSVGLFSRTRRDFSHGCVRVQKPVKLASWILRGRPEWPEDKIEEAMNTGQDNKTVLLKQPIPVVIFYATAYVEPDGVIDFTNDIYGYDNLLNEALASGPPYSTKPVAPVVDVHDER